jgi:hypothetical protein
VYDGEKQLPEPDGGHRVRLNERLRAAFLAGAEEDSQRRLGRGLTVEELERVFWHYPGDIGEHRGTPFS